LAPRKVPTFQGVTATSGARIVANKRQTRLCGVVGFGFLRCIVKSDITYLGLPGWERDRSGTIPNLLCFFLHGDLGFMALTLISSLAAQAALAGIVAPKGVMSYLRHHFLDKTFQGLYQVNAFDLMLLIPYFIVLITLAAYGAHRYWMVYLYYKYKKNKTTEPAGHLRSDELPRVTVQLPIFNEQYVVDRLLDAVCRLDYPKDKLDIQLLDDSTDETVEVARLLVERYAALGHPVKCLHRDNREGFKAGALAEGLKTAQGEFVAIFDADFVPPPDFLMKCIHHFTDPTVGMVQTRWTHINRHYSLLTEVEAILLDGHFVLEHSGRARSGVFFNFNGTAGMWRRCAIDEAGGWEHDTLTEDTDLSYRAQLVGWKFIYLQDVECPAELPVEMTAFKTQQARWAKGLIQVSKKILPRVLKSDVSRHQKIEAWYHLTANLSYPLMIVLSVLLMPAMIIRFYQGWFQMLYIDLPLFMASTFSISSFYLAAADVTWNRADDY
jgi:cellulose synthase/poly-beta-1,6-N-acetylglucosamine synthase-like glycosyltransferase